MARRSKAETTRSPVVGPNQLPGDETQTYAATKPPGSRASYVQDVLRGEILSGKLVVGTPLLQDSIATRLGVSITPVREALRNLESIGLVDYEPHFGAKVAQYASGEVEELYLLRAAIEGLAARLAASTISESELAVLRRRLKSLEAGCKANDPVAMASAARQFHADVAGVGGKTIIVRHLRWIWESHPIPIEESVWSKPDMAAEGVRWYARLLDLIASGDASAAEQSMIEQVRMAAVARERGVSADQFVM